LQAVMAAAMADAPGAKAISIPIPDATTKVNHYSSIYTQAFHLTKVLVRGAPDASWNEDYDMDDEDEEWLGALNKPAKKLAENQFEAVFTQLERLAKDLKEIPESLENMGQITVPDVQPAALADIFKFWKSKREHLKGKSLFYTVKVMFLLFVICLFVCLFFSHPFLFLFFSTLAA